MCMALMPFNKFFKLIVANEFMQMLVPHQLLGLQLLWFHSGLPDLLPQHVCDSTVQTIPDQLL